MKKTLKIVVIFAMVLVFVGVSRSSIELVRGQIDEQLVRNYLLEHPEVYGKLVEEFLSENKTFVYDYLSSNRTAISEYLLANPTIIYDYIASNNTIILDYISENSTLVSSYISEHSELITQFISDNPQIVSDYISTHPDVVRNLLSSYVAEHGQEVLGIAFSVILSQPMLLAGLVGVLVMFPLVGFALGWLIARSKYRKK